MNETEHVDFTLFQFVLSGGDFFVRTLCASFCYKWELNDKTGVKGITISIHLKSRQKQYTALDIFDSRPGNFLINLS